MLKSLVNVLALVVVAAVITGCSSVVPNGLIYNEIVFPAQVNPGPIDTTNMKVGKSEAASYFWLVGSGDASIDPAIKNGNIKEIYYVDWKVSSDWIVGLKTNYTTIVYGK